MPIRINLLAESLAEEDLRRRDPVKRAIIIGALLVAVIAYLPRGIVDTLLDYLRKQHMAARAASTAGGQS